MLTAVEKVQLTVSEAACLDAVKDGLNKKTKIAVETKRDLKTVAKALENLCRAQLISQTDNRHWHPTDHGQHCAIRVVPDPERHRGGMAFGTLVSGSTADRLLNTLDQPRRGAELVDCLGVTWQRVHQIVVKLHAQGRLRLGDREKVLHIVARSNDPTLLLTRDEERILSALPDEAATTVPLLAVAAGVPSSRVENAVEHIRIQGLVEAAGSSRGRTIYRLAAAGRAHIQRRASARRAELPPLKVRSDRVRSVLSYLAERGHARIRDVGDALGISLAV